MLTLLVFLAILSVLIVAHEFGHFLAAKKSGVRVEQFAIGFGPTLLKIKGKETDFYIKAIPMGGYVKLAGDIRSECKGEKSEFLSRAPGIKMLISVAGPVFSYLLGFLFFWIVAIAGFPEYDASPTIGTVLEDHPAASAGLQAGDKVLLVNGKEVNTWKIMAKSIAQSEDQVSLKIDRDGQIVNFEIPLTEKEVKDIFGVKKKVSLIGISPNIKIVKYGIFSGFVKAGQALFDLTYLIVKGLAYLISGKIPFKDSVAGPIGIYYFTDQAVKIGILAILNFTAALSVSLAVINLFPLPVFDGGQILVFFVEKVRGKLLSEKTEDIIVKTGFALLAVLMVLVLFNDVNRFGAKLWGAKTETKP